MPLVCLQELGTWLPNGQKGECGLKTVSGARRRRHRHRRNIGGETCPLGHCPFLALLGYEKNGMIQYHCGGSVINKFYILTAAHCVGTVDWIIDKFGIFK